ncbi:tetratricopeptide repeat protein [Flavobacterium sp.]|uniref:tetratricopeptide repeat-containing sensor histidine kinase n=1 Tax=Flavobacterium sp. TaxID=239 RepID=UPI0038FCB5C3
MRKYFSLLFLFFFFLSFSQNTKIIDDLTIELNKNNKQDSLKVNTLLKLSMACYGSNPEKMLQYANESLQISSKINFKKGIGESNKLLGAANYMKGSFKEAENYFTKALKIFEEIKYYKGIILCYSNLGGIKTVQNEYPEALKLYQNSIRICEKTKETKLAGFANGNMGIIYSELKNYDLALKHYNEALETHIKANYQEGIAANLGNIGNTYFQKKEYNNALEYFNKALKKNIEINNKSGIAREYGNVASVNIEQKNFNDAFENHSKALKINEELKNKKGISVNYQRIGEYYLKQGDFKESRKFLKNANALALEVGIKDIQKESFNSLSDLYEKEGLMDSAYIYFKKYISAKDEIENENNRKQISRLEIQYEFDTKEEKYKTKQLLDDQNLKQQQLLLALNNAKLGESNKERDLVRLNYLKTQSELKAEQFAKNAQKKQLTIAEKEVEIKQKEIKIANLFIQVKEKQKWYLIAGLLLLAIIGSLLFYQNRNRKKINEKLLLLNQNLDLKNAELDEANKAKTRFFSILNHDLRGPVANLVNFLQLQKENPELLDEESIKRMQDKTMSGAENLLTSMEDILQWSKSQMENFKPQPKNIAVETIFEDTKKHFSSEEKVRITFENTSNLKMVTDENYLKTIIRNLTGNAIKALYKTNNPTIIWKAWQEKNEIFLSISDNGKGASNEQFKALYDEKEVVGIKTGLGLHLIRDLAKAINCEIKVESKLNQGTTFILNLKK